MVEEKRVKELQKKYKLPTEQEVADEIEVQKNVVKNLNYIMFKYDIKVQKDLADILDIGAPQLTKILKGEQTPTLFPCLANIVRRFNYSIDEFLFTDIEITEKYRNGADENLPVANYMKFLGVYQLYYFDTSAFKGRERRSHGDSLKSGIMYVEKNPKTEKYSVMAIFNMRKERADSFYKNELKNGNAIASSCRSKIINAGGTQHVYYGELELSSKHVFINLRFENAKDRVQMIFHRPESNSNQYIGGLGTMVSVSKGRNAAPCLQYIAMANASLNVSEEELASHLLMHYPNIKTYDTIDDLVEFTTDLYASGADGKDRLSKLSDEQKKSLVRNYMDKIVNDTVEKNLFRTVIVSPADDDEFYHYIKRVKSNMRAEVK